MPTEFSPAALKSYREAKGLTQDGLALLINVSRPAICQYESGDRTPSLGVFNALADALGVRPDRLLRRTNGQQHRATRPAAPTSEAA